MDVTFTDRELDIMDVLWEHGPATVAEVQGRLGDPLAYTTVLTILRTLEEKGHVGHEEEGRAYRYHAEVARDAAERSAVRQLVRKVFRGSPELLLTQLVSDRKLTGVFTKRMCSVALNNCWSSLSFNTNSCWFRPKVEGNRIFLMVFSATAFGTTNTGTGENLTSFSVFEPTRISLNPDAPEVPITTRSMS